ncbi:MAG: LCP family protein [Saccharofermentans sp.]|nr:LCP family protein [Saccharofermentans sp.]
MSKKSLIACICTTLVVVLLFLAYFAGLFGRKTVEVEPISTEYHRQYIGDFIENNGHVYQYNTDLTNILFLGIDTEDTLNRFTNPAYAGQSDAIYLLTLDRSNNEARFLQINRNAMVDIDIFDPDGNVMLTMPGQICLQYAYGTGSAQSVWAAKKSVSNLLFDIPIDSYFVMNLEGINTINDAINGVYITMPQDYTVIDSSMRQGARVHIIGNLAERFVRYRDINEFNSVADRMERQVLYIEALLENFSQGSTYDFYYAIEPLFDDVILTNLDWHGFDELTNYNYHNCRVDALPGEEVATDNWEEFHVDNDALEQYVIENFYVLSE